MSKINEIKQFDELQEGDARWYSSIKSKIRQLPQGYGTIDVVLKIKAGKVFSIEHITKGSENIG